MKSSRARWLSTLAWMAAWSLGTVVSASAQDAQIAARRVDGTLHAYLVMRNESGQVLASGDLVQVVRRSRVTNHLVFHFKDGSIDDETTIFTQRGVFHLVSDHHIQKGPFFPHPLDLRVDARKGEVTVQSYGSDGKSNVQTDRMKMPPNLCSPSMLALIAMNLAPAAGGQVSMVVATPKPRLVRLEFTGMGASKFSVAGSERQALHYEGKFDLGGVAQAVAPLVGKQPPDIEIWIEPGEVPGFVKEVGVLSAGGPVVSIQQTGPVGPKYTESGSGK